MANWSQTPEWIPVAHINEGNQYVAQDGVTVDDMNNIINNMIYVKKYGGRINTLSTGATVDGHTLKLQSEEA